MINQLLICPECLDQGVKNVLGSVDPYGRLVIMRYRGEKKVNNTTIEALGEYMVICQCGFGTTMTKQTTTKITVILPS